MARFRSASRSRSGGRGRGGRAPRGSRSRSSGSSRGGRQRERSKSRSRSGSRGPRRGGRRSSGSSSRGRQLPKAWRNRKGSGSPSEDRRRSARSRSQSLLWRRLKRIRPKSASRERQRDLDDEDKEDERDLDKQLAKQVRGNRRREAIQTALKLLEGGLHCDSELLIQMLENAAESPGPELFAETLHLCVAAGGLKLSPEEFAKILGIMVFRNAPVPQIRAFLNVSVPKTANVVPVIPGGLTEVEALQMFRDERGEVREDQGEIAEEDDEEDEDRLAPPTAITMQKCKAWPQLNGRYVLCLELSAPGRPVYEKEVKDSREEPEDLLEAALESSRGKDRKKRILVRYRERASGTEPGWAIGIGLKGEVMMLNSREARSPPCLGWQAILENEKVDDPGGFMQKQVGLGLPPRGPPAYPPPPPPPSGPASQEQGKGASSSSGGRPIDPKSARRALERLDLAALRGHIRTSDPWVAEYFGHFVVLAHLEHLADVLGIKRRRERSSADQLVRWGWALSGMRLLNTFGRKEAGGRGRVLPGWEDQGIEMAALQLPQGPMAMIDMDRMRIKRGDSITVSHTDPLQDKVGDGTVQDIRPGTIVVQLRGNFPEDAREHFWRVDKAANATVYERQMLALLQLAHASKVQPTVTLLTSAPVGLADKWAAKWQKGGNSGGKDMRRRDADKKDQAKSKRRRSRPRSSSSGRKKRNGKQQQSGRKSRSRSGSRASKRRDDEDANSDSSAEREEEKRQMRCRELAETEVSEYHEDKILQARRQVNEIESMNNSQREAINASLKQTCTVVQGPPGTGKTSVSVQILSFWTKVLQLTPVLATSDSNVAVDNICEGLRARGVKAIRVGRPEKVRGVIEDMTLEAELKKVKQQQLQEAYEKADEEGDENGKKGGGKFPPPGGKSGGKMGCKGGMGGMGLLEDAGEAAIRVFEDRRTQNRQDYELQMKILREAEVICTTTIAAGMDFLSRIGSFEGILVDEVAQATELSTAVPVILRGTQRLVLVGDHCQLPPAVLSPEAEVRGLSLSVYSRLIQAGGLKAYMLDTQYRSHPKLAEFSSKAFYDGQLGSGVEADQRPLPQGVPWPNKSCPIAFINVESQEEMEGDSKANSVEAQLVASLVGKVLQYGELTIGQVGVVTPYVAQVRRLRQLLRPVLPPGQDPRLMECASVDNFQGREKELIVFSAVRSNHAGNVGFLADWRRLNVMLTRARRGLLIFGNRSTLKSDPIWEKWLTFAEKHDCIVSDMVMPKPLQSMMGGCGGHPGAGKGGMSWAQQTAMHNQQVFAMQQMKGYGKGPGAKGFGMQMPKAFMPGAQMSPAARAAVAAKQIAADLQSGSDAGTTGAEAESSSGIQLPAAFARPAPGQQAPPTMPPVSPAPQVMLEKQMQNLQQMESELNSQKQQLQQKQMQVQQVFMINPMQGQMQMQLLQQEMMQLQQRWDQFSNQKTLLQQQQQMMGISPQETSGSEGRNPYVETSGSEGRNPYVDQNEEDLHLQLEQQLQQSLQQPS